MNQRDGPITGVLERNEIAYSQCPVVLYRNDLSEAIDRAETLGLEFRDEATLIRHMRPDITLESVEGHQSGFKLTYPGDFEILKIHLAHLSATSRR